MQRDSPDSRPVLHRRRLLAAAGASLAAAVAGCSSLPGMGEDTPADLSFEKLHQTPTYVAEDADLSMPEEVPVVEANNADLLVLPGDTGVDAQQAADWLAADRAIALLGDAAEPTWIDWERSDAFHQTFENKGYGDSSPDPDLLVGAAVGMRTTTYNRTWSDGPRERDLLRALDETLVDLAQRTPR